ncbi:MAG: S1 RNA-binding domain-containing protein [Anaerolineae bacterium]|nr:S1 RNA-binding domain-containing protein [Anaerolineae bacterium]
MGQEVSTLNIPPRKVVKTLAVGQGVEGVVKRVTEFGAFVDIGVGRDGLVHVSEMAPYRVAKATDIVKEGDRVQVWIKELDRDKNRISLTMIAPGVQTLRDLEEGAVVTGRVTRLERYGAFVDIGVGRDGMLHVKEMSRGYVEKPEDVVKVGDEIQVQIIGIDRRRGRIDLSMKELLPPEPPKAAVQPPQQPEEPEEPLTAVADDEDFISPFELAFQEANQRTERRRERRKKSRAWEMEEDEDEDLIRRTIAHHRRSKGL